MNMYAQFAKIYYLTHKDLQNPVSKYINTMCDLAMISLARNYEMTERDEAEEDLRAHQEIEDWKNRIEQIL